MSDTQGTQNTATSQRGGASHVDQSARSAWPSVADSRGFVSVRAMGLVAAVAFGVVLVAFTRTARLQIWDEKARNCTGSSGRAWALIVDPLGYITEASLALCLVTCVVFAVLRRRVALAVAAVIVVAGANISTQLLKAYWPTSPHFGDNSLPSGHSTAAMSLSLAVVLVAPAAWRRFLVPISAFLSTFVGAGTIVGHWHRPADVIAAFLSCLAWSALAIGLVLRFQGRRHLRHARYSVRPGLAVAGASLAGLIFILLGVRPLHHEVKWLEAGLTFSAIGLLSALVVTWVAAAADDNLG